MIKKNDRPKFVAEAIYTNTLEGKRVSDFFLKKQAGIATMKSTLLNLIAAFASTTAFHRLS